MKCMRGRNIETTILLLQNTEIGSEHKTQEACIELENCILDSKEVKGEKEKTNLGIKVIHLVHYFCNKDTIFSTPEEREKSFDVLIREIYAFKEEGFIITRLIYALRVRDEKAKDQKGFEYGEDKEFIKKCISRLKDLDKKRVITHLADGEYEQRITSITQELGNKLRANERRVSQFGRPVGALERTEEPIQPTRKGKRRA